MRANSTMKALAAGLNGAMMKNLATCHAGLQPEAANLRRPRSTAQSVERCDRCHGANGNSTDPRMPLLAGRNEAYPAKVLNAYRAGTRRSPVVSAMADGLSKNAVPTFAACYARQQARFVVYLPLPARYGVGTLAIDCQKGAIV